tara:strand:- start:518 stop:691 length:174 start_codon:yes stop_codon:yes gene_type:complete
MGAPGALMPPFPSLLLVGRFPPPWNFPALRLTVRFSFSNVPHGIEAEHSLDVSARIA